MNVTYHSIHGAIAESQHVFIGAGLRPGLPGTVRILEIGLGTGLNLLLTRIAALETGSTIHYLALEPYPLTGSEWKKLNYCASLNREELQPFFERIHHCGWEAEQALEPDFFLYKTKCSLLDFTTDQRFDLVYFDAFAPNAQPELWTRPVFEKLYERLLAGGSLVTYCSKGDVRRAMQAAGFIVEKIPGPPRKREMVRARKPV